MILSHDDLGSGRTVVLLHSGITDRRMWRQVGLGLSSAFQVIAPDLRGFGDSSMPAEVFADADDIAALLDVLGVEQAVVVGSSLGGRVALELASTHPGRVSALVLICPALRGAARTEAAAAFREQEGRLLAAGRLDDVVDLNARTWLGPDAGDDTRELLAAMFGHALDVQLAAESATPPPQRREIDVVPAEVEVPTTVVTGGQDMDHFQAVAALLAREIPAAELVTLPWAGHLPSLERPDEVTTLLLELLHTCA